MPLTTHYRSRLPLASWAKSRGPPRNTDQSPVGENLRDNEASARLPPQRASCSSGPVKQSFLASEYSRYFFYKPIGSIGGQSSQRPPFGLPGLVIMQRLIKSAYLQQLL